jgi:hypothetical protein
MNLADVMDELGIALEVIPGLRIFPYTADKVTPPAAIVMWPDSYEFDRTMQRGSDAVTLPIVVVVGRADARSSRDRLAKYVDGSGSDSVKAAIEDHASDVYDSVRVTSVEFNQVTIASIDYLAATFNVDIVAPGKVA